MFKVERIENEKINLGNVMFLDLENGWFYVDTKTSNDIYRVKGIICSYSGLNEWATKTMGWLLTLYSGNDPHNFALGTSDQGDAIKNMCTYDDETKRNEAYDVIEKSSKNDIGQKVVETFEFIVNNMPGVE